MPGYIIWIVTFDHLAFAFAPGINKGARCHDSSLTVIGFQYTNQFGGAGGHANNNDASQVSLLNHFLQRDF